VWVLHGVAGLLRLVCRTRLRRQLRQSHEAFIPHVVAITTGSTVEFPNDDPVFHNVFLLSQGAMFDLGRYDYATRKELSPPAPSGRSLRLIGLEVEYSVGHTKVSGEWVRDVFETDAEPAKAYAWFAEAVQTVTPRWFVAVRQEGSSSPGTVVGNAIGARTSYQTVETTAGYRVTPDLTLRAGYIGRKAFAHREFDHQVAASGVWARRWW
jgi:hypothetical protein